jgi:hypothetical protein
MKLTVRRVTIPVLLILTGLILLTIVIMLTAPLWRTEYARSTVSCQRMVFDDYLSVSYDRERRFLGKVREDRALCRGGDRASDYLDVPWADWANYWGTEDASSRGPDKTAWRIVSPTDRGITGALMDLEFQRIGLIKFNLFDNYTYRHYVQGNEDGPGSTIHVWDEMRLPPKHANFDDVGGDGEQVCNGSLIRHRTLTGICNDIENPLMGSTNTLFARNVQFETSFPRLGENELTRNRHGDRLDLLKPDPQLISVAMATGVKTRIIRTVTISRPLSSTSWPPSGSSS